MHIVKPSSQSLLFPSPESALRDPNGLLAIGGDLTVPRLREAYEHGIYPWYSPGKAILWWSPDPRAILFPAERHLGRSLKRFLRSNPFCITINHDFAAVIAACAHRPHEGTWIGPEMLHAYLQLHLLGYAHSVEVWQQGQLVGGMYGVAQGALFCGESMFSHVSNASKCAMMAFCQHFAAYGGELIDCQVLNAHTAQLGAREIPRHQFLQQLSDLQRKPLVTGCWLSSPTPTVGCAALSNKLICGNGAMSTNTPLHNVGFSALSCRLKIKVVRPRGLDGQRRQY